MTLFSDTSWFSEASAQTGTAFSLKIKQKLCDEQTQFQHIEIYQTTHFGHLMVLDGFVMLSQRDNFLYHEMMSHPVLFTHSNPQNVLIIGGGDCGTLREVLRHQTVKKVDQVELDKRVTDLSALYFPELCESNDDARANFYFTNGIDWVKKAKPESYDVIIIDCTDPVGSAQALFENPFYEDCSKALAHNGILCQQSESPLLHMNILKAMYRELKIAGFSTATTIQFPQPVYPGGWWSATMGSKNVALTTFREHDVTNKSFSTEYYNLDIHRAALAQPEFFKRCMETQ